MNSSTTLRFPLLEEFLSLKNIPIQATYTVRDLARLFGVSGRAIQNRVSTGQISARDLPGRARFLSQDLEDFLVSSKKKKDAYRGNRR